MNKFFRALVVLVAVATSGCATIGTPMGPRTVVFLQRGLILQVTHTCTDHGRLYQAGRGLVAVVRGAEPQEVPLGPAILGDREIQVTFQSLSPDGKVVGVYAQRFGIDYHSTTAQTWIIGGGWLGGGWHTMCHR